MSEIIVVGSLNMDLVVKTTRAPEAGETITGESFQTIPGGKGANQAAAIARLDGSVVMVGRVGRDDFGERLLRNLEGMGVDTGHIRVDTQSTTGVALITVDGSGENRIIIIPGANGRVDSSDVQSAVSLMRDARLVVLQLEIPLSVVTQIVGIAHQNHVQVLLNPAPTQPLPDELLRMVDYLVLNETEASQLSGISVSTPETAGQAGKKLLERGVGVVVLTLGAQGSVIVTKDEIHHVPAYPIKAVDTTAAGDAFIGGFVVSLLQKLDLPANVRYGNAAGGLAATKLGAQSSLPMRHEVERLLS